MRGIVTFSDRVKMMVERFFDCLTGWNRNLRMSSRRQRRRAQGGARRDRFGCAASAGQCKHGRDRSHESGGENPERDKVAPAPAIFPSNPRDKT